MNRLRTQEYSLACCAVFFAYMSVLSSVVNATKTKTVDFVVRFKSLELFLKQISNGMSLI